MTDNWPLNLILPLNSVVSFDSSALLALLASLALNALLNTTQKAKCRKEVLHFTKYLVGHHKLVMLKNSFKTQERKTYFQFFFQLKSFFLTHSIKSDNTKKLTWQYAYFFVVLFYFNHDFMHVSIPDKTQSLAKDK